MNTEPLVTVGVVTYNSAEFILETLDSVYRQTYKNIELIISDDCSTDDTVKKAREWLDSHKDRFVRSLVITVPKNTGTSGNGNRAIFQAQGEWYKSLDGDDILADTAIEDYVNFVKDKPNVGFVFGRIESFTGKFDKANLIPHKPAFYPYLYKDSVTANQQYKFANKYFIGSGSSDFYNLKVLRDEMHGFDERFPLMEDMPIFIKLTKHGYKLWLLDKVTLFYRVSSASISHSIENEMQILSNNTIRCLKEYRYLYVYENSNCFWKLCLKYKMYLENTILKLGNSKNGIRNRLVFMLYKYTNPYNWHWKMAYIWLKLKN